MSARAGDGSLAVAVFARTPVAGAAKTRLIPRLGAEGAARLQAQLTQLALARAMKVAPGNTSLWLAGEPAPYTGQNVVPVHVQRGDDLGVRMALAFETLLPQHAAVLLIGTDCPAQTDADLRDAALSLETHDVVVQPADDGGYVLIGLSQRVLHHTPSNWRELFCGVAWGTSSVFAQTQDRLAATGLRHALLPSRPDLDVAQDYERAVQSGWIVPVDGGGSRCA